MKGTKRKIKTAWVGFVVAHAQDCRGTVDKVTLPCRAQNITHREGGFNCMSRTSGVTSGRRPWADW